MNRLTLICTLLLFFISSCEGPISNLSGTTTEPLPESVAPKISYSSQPVQPDDIRRHAWQQFRNTNGSKWHIRWNEHTGLPASVPMGKSKKKYHGSPKKSARAFLSDHPALFGMQTDPATLKHKRSSTNPYGLKRAIFQQHYKDIPVQDAQYIVHIFKDGSVGMAQGTYYPNIEAPSSPSASSDQAISTAKTDLGLVSPIGVSHKAALLMYLKEDGNFTPAWKTTISADEPNIDWMYFIDATNGAVLQKQNQIAFLNSGKASSQDPCNGTFATGEGLRYYLHPNLSSIEEVSFPRLCATYFKLFGKYANVINSNITDITSDSEHSFLPQAYSHKAEVNVYYHVDDFRHNFIGPLEYSGDQLDFIQIDAYVESHHQQFSDRGAWFKPGDFQIHFGDGGSRIFLNDSALEAKVVYHEYSHAILYDINSEFDLDFDDQEAAIYEGVPDYFAAAHTRHPLIADYVDPNSNLIEVRDITDPEYNSLVDYENANGDRLYKGGELFSHILWELRSAIGAIPFDFFVFDALHGLDSNPNFLEFRDALYTTSEGSLGGYFSDDIIPTFASFGIGDSTDTPALPTYSVSISGAQTTNLASTETWTANVTDGNTPYTYSWQKKKEGQNYFYVVGNSSSYTENIQETDDFDLRIKITDDEGYVTYDTIHVTVNDNPF
ncbi:MAG: hypothetical protein U5J95_08295 [Balneolaceae bacterium]|nr:hypothetical protein [Balneolaceae bacterium]